MSHYTEIEVEFDVDATKELMEALEIQFGKGNVEYHKEGADLFGYQGDNRAKAKEGSPNYAPPCEIVIRRQHVGGAANDVGFKAQPNGKYMAYVSEYDAGNTFTAPKRAVVNTEYCAKVFDKVAKAQGYQTVERIKQADGKTIFRASNKSVASETIKLKNW